MSILENNHQKVNCFIALAFALLLVSCKQKENTTRLPVTSSDTVVTKKETTKAVNEQINDTIKLVIKNENGSYRAEGSIDSIHSRIYVKFTNKIVGKLKATITTLNGDGNIRFNQILFPDKTADGPFGKEIEQQLKQTGEHTLIIGHSLMADGQYQGKFKVDLEITER